MRDVPRLRGLDRSLPKKTALYGGCGGRPLAAIAPASAAVQSPAGGQTTCTGGWKENTISKNGTYTYVGTWHLQASTGVILDSASLTPIVLCDVVLSGTRDVAYREQGTSDCVAYVPSAALVEMRGCDYSSANQQWSYNGAQMFPESDNQGCLDGSGGDTPVFMNTCVTGAPDNQYWYYNPQ